MPAPAWADYLAEFHDSRPGITEIALAHAADREVGTAYDWLVQGLAVPLGDVVDLACGNAALQPRLRRYESYVGVDRSSTELAQARHRGRGPVIQADVRALPLEDESVDVVVSSMGLMLVVLVEPVEQVLSEVRRILRPGGRVVLLVPAPWPLHPRDLPVLLGLSLALRGPGSMPQRLGRSRVRRSFGAVGLQVQDLASRRFPFPLENVDDARLAVRSLYTPGRTAAQLAAAERLLVRRHRPGATLPVPLLRIIARRPHAAESL